MSKKPINLNDFDSSQIFLGEVVKHTKKTMEGDVTFRRINLSYTEDEAKIAFKLPLCCTDDNGVTTAKARPNVKIMYHRYKPRYNITKDSWEFPASYNGHDNTNTELMSFVEIVNEIRSVVAEKVAKKLAKTNLGFKPADLKNPIYTSLKEDEDGIPKSTYFDLMACGPTHPKTPGKIFTTFYGLNGKVIPIKNLEKKRIFFEPEVSIENVFIGKDKKIVCQLRRALVYAIQEPRNYNVDTERINEIISADPSLLAAFERSIGNNEKENDPEIEEEPEEEPEEPEEPEEEEEQPPKPRQIKRIMRRE